MTMRAATRPGVTTPPRRMRPITAMRRHATPRAGRPRERGRSGMRIIIAPGITPMRRDRDMRPTHASRHTPGLRRKPGAITRRL